MKTMSQASHCIEHDWEDENLKGLIGINQNKCHNDSMGQTEDVCREMKRKEN